MLSHGWTNLQRESARLTWLLSIIGVCVRGGGKTKQFSVQGLALAMELFLSLCYLD